MAAVDAVLKHLIGASLVALEGYVDAESPTGVASTQIEQGLRDRLDTLIVDVSTVLEEGGNVNVANFPATQPVSGSVSVSNLAGLGLDTSLQDILAKLVEILASTDAIDPDASNQLLTDIRDNEITSDAALLAKLEAIRSLLDAPLTISGTVGVSNFPATQTVDGAVSVSNLPATQPVSIAATVDVDDNATEFWRIKNKRFLDTEEVRYDIPADLTSASIYTGVATDATATSSASWTVIRTYFDANGNPNRERIRTAVAWDSRTAGW